MPVNTKKIISVWIIEDNDLYQKTIAKLINDQVDMQCERMYSSCEEALATLKLAPPPDVILHDIGFIGMDGIESVGTIKRDHPGIQIIIITIYDDAEHIFDALSAGAIGYLLKTSREEKIIHSIRDAMDGGSPMNSSIARKVTEFFSKQQKSNNDYKLSDREKEILELVVAGLGNIIIAEKLHLSTHTVDAHLRNIYEKLHVHSRTEAAVKVFREKLF